MSRWRWRWKVEVEVEGEMDAAKGSAVVDKIRVGFNTVSVAM